MQHERVALMEHDHLGLGAIQRETGHAQLFDTLYVLQSFAGGDDDALERVRERHGVEVRDSRRRDALPADADRHAGRAPARDARAPSRPL